MKDIKTSSVIIKNNLKYFTFSISYLIFRLIMFFYYTFEKFCYQYIPVYPTPS